MLYSLMGTVPSPSSDPVNLSVSGCQFSQKVPSNSLTLQNHCSFRRIPTVFFLSRSLSEFCKLYKLFTTISFQNFWFHFKKNKLRLKASIIDLLFRLLFNWNLDLTVLKFPIPLC